MNDYNKPARPRGTDKAEVIQVIVTHDFVGVGNHMGDPCRIVKKYWDFDGHLLADDDKYKQSTKE